MIIIRIIVFLFIVLTSNLVNSQKKKIEAITIPTESHTVDIVVEQGTPRFHRKSDNHFLAGEHIFIKTKLNRDTDIANSYYPTAIRSIGLFKNGYKDGLWKTTYENKLVKTQNYNNGLVIGRYRVYNNNGDVLYKITFGSQGNGKYKDYYYNTGTLKEEGQYENGKKQGEWCRFDEEGTLIESIDYRKGVPIEKE
ncbi:MORN repeat protein [Mesonia algae]|uniref:MORN repeat protein n=1 Tax=Mesonia algae TaxID=213248 RepID=A0A2W7I943_9FLAO|nr:MORN repeat protein [Mesonia algae]